jgi:hypothetical protein
MKKLLMFCAVVGFVFALANTAMAAKWNVPGDFATIQEAIDDAGVLDGDTILVGKGNHAGALVTKAVEIKGQGGAVINDGPELGNYVCIRASDSWPAAMVLRSATLVLRLISRS